MLEKKAIVKKYQDYIEKNHFVYNPKDLNDIKYIDMAWDEAIKKAQNEEVKLNDYYENGRFLPYSVKERYQSGNDFYALNNGLYGGFKKVDETKTTVTFEHHGNNMKIDKSEFAKDKATVLKNLKQKEMESLRIDGLYRLGKQNGLKVTRKMKSDQLKYTIQQDKTVKQKAMDLDIWDIYPIERND